MSAPIVGGAAALTSVLCLLAGVHGVTGHRVSSTVRRRLAPGDTARIAGVLARRAPVTDVPGWFARRVRVLDVATPPVVLWRWWLASLPLSTVVTAVLMAPTLSVVSMGVVLSLPFALPWVGRGRRARRADAQLPALLDAIAAGLRAGDSLHQATLAAASVAPHPLGTGLEQVVRACAAGRPLPDELDEWAQRSGSAMVRIAAAALSIGLRDGGPQAHAISGVAATVRDRLAVSGELRALSSQARASAVVIVVAPAAFALVSAAVDHAVFDFLVGSPGGIACVVAGLTLDATGAAWMTRIVRGAP